MEYKPDIIISVHPLMQHIPLWVLKWQGLQKKVVFVTVITDLNSCHPKWWVFDKTKTFFKFFNVLTNWKHWFRFHPGVNRCYCPSNEVAKRALYDGLEESQVRVFGLPIWPSFAGAVLSKVSDLRHKKILGYVIYMITLMGFSGFFFCRMTWEKSLKWILICLLFY